MNAERSEHLSPNPSPQSGEGRKRSLAEWAELLGPDVFFVPCERGTKKPMVTYVERPFEATRSEAYRSIFDQAEANVAVYLGKASGGLCAIDFDHD